MCSSQKYSSVLGVDANLNCGNFFLTLISKEFEDYHYLESLLKTHCKNFETLTAFGTAGEINLANAFE